MLRILLIVWSSLRMRDFWVKDTYSPGVPWKLEVVVSHPRDQIRCQVHLLQMNWSFYYFCFSWSIIALQCVLVSVVQKSGSAIGMPASPPVVSSLPPFRSAWRTRLSFLRPPAPSHWLFHTHQGYSPAHSNPPHVHKSAFYACIAIPALKNRLSTTHHQRNADQNCNEVSITLHQSEPPLPKKSTKEDEAHSHTIEYQP